MVTGLRSLPVALFAALLCAPWAAHAAGLEIVTKTNETSYGLPIDMEIRAHALARSLGDIDLRPLDEDFAPVTRQLELTGPAGTGDAVQTLHLKLYPRHPGTLLVPTLHFAGLRSQPREIRVTAPAIDGHALRVRTTVSDNTVWQRAQLRVLVEVEAAQSFARLETGPGEVAGFDVFPLPAERQEIPAAGAPRALLRTGWSLFARASGAHLLDLPPVRYMVDGVALRVFYLPKLRLEVRALPPYLPPSLPVGSLRLSSTIMPANRMLGETLAYWHIKTDSDALLPEGLPGLSRQLRSDSRVAFLPAHVHLDTRAGHDGVRSELSYDVPFKPLANGRLALPVLRASYFDPASGRLREVTLQAPTPLVLNVWWRAVILVTLLGGIGLGTRRMWRLWRRRRDYRQRRDEALTRLATSASMTDLRSALALLAAAEGWPVNLSLSAWGARWRQRFTTTPDFESTLQRLAHACYAADAPCEITELRWHLLFHCRSPRRHRAPWRGRRIGALLRRLLGPSRTVAV